MSHKPYPVARPFWTPGTLVMLVLMGAMFVTLCYPQRARMRDIDRQLTHLDGSGFSQRLAVSIDH